MTSNGDQLRASVIVPFLDAENAFEKLLPALEAQTLPREQFEVIVIDNGSRDELVRRLEETHRAGSIKLLRRLDRRGSYAARNLGIEESRAPVLAFTDADCVPGREWLASGIRALETAPRVAGRVLLTPSARPALAERLDRARFLRQERYVGEGFGATANLFARRFVFEAVGLFDERLVSGGDYELGQRAERAGYPIVYSDDATVLHPCRRTFGSLLEKAGRVGYGFGQSVRFHGVDWRRLGSRVTDRLTLSTGPMASSWDAPLHQKIVAVLGHAAMSAATLRGCARGCLNL